MNEALTILFSLKTEIKLGMLCSIPLSLFPWHLQYQSNSDVIIKYLFEIALF